jgi:hypothetical protein
MESSCELGIETSGFIKFWVSTEWLYNCSLSSGNQLHIVSELVS